MPFKPFFKKRKGASVTQPTPSCHPSPSIPREAVGFGPISESYPSGTQLVTSSVATPNELLAPHPSNAPIPPPTKQVPASGSASSPVFFENAHDFVLNNPTIITRAEIFDSQGGAAMQLLESQTIRGAEHDSSARYPPPKCHPGTRETLKKEIFHWAADSKRSWRMFYILGSAGVGKSAIAQSVADEIDCLGASCFISRPNGRNDPDGVISTLSYQLAVRHDAYRRIITEKIARDPTILRKTRRVQFKELLVDPFHILITRDTSVLQKRLLIIIDGLDECKDEEAQCEFIELIGDHVRSFPEFPLLWLICSRPEWHLKLTLSQADFQVTCRREEISVDDEGSRQDVLLYLRGQFRNIRFKYQDSLDCDWPPETDLLRIATAASGLFAFASTVVRFVGDVEAGNPSRQLRLCMKALEGSRTSVGQNPYLILDSLYQHILSSVPSKTLQTTMRILGMSILYPHGGPSQTAQALANFFLIGKAAFYHALKQLHSVLRVPSSFLASTKSIEIYHASFADFLRDPVRSGEFHPDETVVHYDIALTGLRWHTGLGREIQEDDIWISSSETAQTCVESIKSQSLTVLWEACSHVEGENAISLHQELQNFDFKVLGSFTPAEWQFDDFLSWLSFHDANSSTQNLINSLNSYASCNEIGITEVYISRQNLPDFVTRGFGNVSKVHLDVGNGENCRHMHINHFMERLLGGTIPGAESHPAASKYISRCHPRTRLRILERCLYFIGNCEGSKKMLLVVGPARVGKSVIMQCVVDSLELQVSYNASVFLSANGCRDATKAIVTISYQFAAKSEAYRQVVEKEITCNPSLLQSSMAVQFDKLIVEPFIRNPKLKSAGRVLVIIDSLNECRDRRSQRMLLHLISSFCSTYPSSSLVWLITSRPEPHIVSFFSAPEVIPTYEKEELPVDMDEIHRDVEQFLRSELMEIKEEFKIFDPRWPKERDIWKLANTAGGLFAYAQTVIRYIRDPQVASPVSQFDDLMHCIDTLQIAGPSGERCPLVLLDALYEWILSKVPDYVMDNTRKILQGTRRKDVILCNCLGMNSDDAYVAINPLRSIILVPPRDKAHEDLPRAFHKSFIDCICDPTRSRIFPDFEEEARRLEVQCAFRIVTEAPDGIDVGDVNYKFLYGITSRGPGTSDKLSLTWPAGEASSWNDNEMRLRMYQWAIGVVANRISLGDPGFKNEFYVRLLITRFQAYYKKFPYHQLRRLVLDESLRPNFKARGILKEIPIKVVVGPKSRHLPKVELQFRRSATTVTNLIDPWQVSCKHQRVGKWEKGKDESWMTIFHRRNCDFCFERFKRQVEILKRRSPEHTVMILFTSTGMCCVELRFVDPEDGVSEWAYWFWSKIPLEERKKLSSPV